MRQAALAAAAAAALLVSPSASAQLGGISVPGVPSGVSVSVPGGTVGTGGVTVGTGGVTVGTGGVSTSVTVGVPGTGGVGAATGLGLSGVGASVGVGGVGVGAGIGTGGVSAGVGTGGVGGGAGGVGGVGGGSGTGGGFGGGPATTGAISGGVGSSPGFGAGPVASIALPRSLAPLDLVGESRFTAFFPEFGSVSGTREDVRNFRSPLRARSRLPDQVVRNCREAIIAAALPYGVMRVDAAAAGPMRSARAGYSAPIEFRIVYSRRGGLETRQATIDCRMNTAGRVVAAA